MKTIDTRDLQKRLDELESLRDVVPVIRDELKEHRETPRPDSGGEEWDETETELENAVEAAEAEFGPDEQEELAELENLASEISDFRHGGQMIPVRDFEEYAQEFAEEIGAIPRDTAWPCTCIDWSAAAEALADDYTEVSYQGTDYYVRA